MKQYKVSVTTRYGVLPTMWMLYSPEVLLDECRVWASHNCSFSVSFREHDMLTCAECEQDFLPMMLPEPGAIPKCMNCTI